MQENPVDVRGAQDVPARKDVFVQRLIIGLVQGETLYFLLQMASHKSAFASQLWFAPVLLAVFWVLPMAAVSVGHLRWQRIVLWCALLTAVVMALGHHNVWRAAGESLGEPFPGDTPGVRWPGLSVSLLAGAMVYVSYALILAGETRRALLAPYASYFDFSWKLALQIALSGFFVAVLFAVLWIGAALFLLLKLYFLRNLLRYEWFDVPVAAIAFAASLHITDMRAELIRGMRTLVLTLMSWLLPLLVLIVGGFLLSLPFTGLAPLWATRMAATLLLVVAVLTIVLINAVFKSGAQDADVPRVLRVAARAACLMLVAVVMLAGYALKLRIAQYGWSDERVLACAIWLLSGCYAFGYAWAAFERRTWLQRIAPTNVLCTWAALAILVALYTPVADPARLAVDSQVGRLLSGRVAPEQFDFEYLRQRAGVYGKQALGRLQVLQTGANAAAIRLLSSSAHDKTVAAPAPDAALLAAQIAVRTPGQTLPPSFLAFHWSTPTPQRWALPGCLLRQGEKCDAYVLDLNGNHTQNVLLFAAHNDRGTVFGPLASGGWEILGRISVPASCAGLREALAQGHYRLVAPPLQDVEIDGQRMAVARPDTAGLKCE